MAFLRTRLGITRLEADEHYQKALGFYRKNNLDQAVLHMNAAVELYPNRAEYYAARGLFRLQDGLPHEAKADFDEALKRNPYEMLANYGAGVIAYQQEQFEAALESFNKAWAAQPQRPETLYYLALTQHRLRENAQALYWMQQAAARYAAIDDREARRHKRDADQWLAEFEKLLV